MTYIMYRTLLDLRATILHTAGPIELWRCSHHVHGYSGKVLLDFERKLIITGRLCKGPSIQLGLPTCLFGQLIGKRIGSPVLHRGASD